MLGLLSDTAVLISIRSGIKERRGMGRMCRKEQEDSVSAGAISTRAAAHSMGASAVCTSGHFLGTLPAFPSRKRHQGGTQHS